MLPDVGIFNAVALSVKSLPKLLITLAVAAAFSFAHPAKANLITNPGFETGDVTGWTKVGLADVIRMNSGIAPHSGNFQARLFTGTLTQSVATTPGASYTINFFLALASNQSNNSFSVSWGGVPILSLTNQSPFGYTEYSFTETASTASSALVFSYNVVIPFSVWRSEERRVGKECSSGWSWNEWNKSR